jgi:enoyl-CoA hydratase/carnithine racemase
MAIVRLDRRERVGWITLNRPHVLNASNLEMKRELVHCVEAAEADTAVGAIVLTGSGRAFCVGGDLKESAGYSDDQYSHSIEMHHRACLALVDAQKPIIAAINGYALAGGLELAMMCDIRIAATTANFGIPVAKVSSVSTGALYHRLIRTIGLARTTHLAMTADPISAVEAERFGLVTRICEASLLDQEAQQLAARISSYPSWAVGLMKQGLRESLDADFDRMLKRDEELAATARQPKAIQKG